MARPLRIEFPGGLYHPTSRGDRREAIFLCDADKNYWLHYWLDLLGQVCSRHNWLCHAYCLMDNHFHIVVELNDGNLSAGMRQLNGVYTQWHNGTRSRIGHVFRADLKRSSCSAKRTCWSCESDCKKGSKECINARPDLFNASATHHSAERRIIAMNNLTWILRAAAFAALAACGVASASPWVVPPTELQGRCYGVMYATASRLTFRDSYDSDCNGVKCKRSSRAPTEKESRWLKSVERFDLQGKISATCGYTGFDVMTREDAPTVSVNGFSS